MKLIYIWDAYCGWCYGFEPTLTAFMEKHPELELTVISGGLFTGDNSQALRHYPYMASVNEQISQLTGAEFGQAYQEVLADGELVVDSTHPAIAYKLLSQGLSSREKMQLVYEMQKLFYQEGKSLSNAETYRSLVGKTAVTENKVAAISSQLDQTHIALSDFQKAQVLGVHSFPTLLIEVEGKLYDLRQGAHTVEELENHYQQIKAL